jgi:hypothetical protein
MLKDVWAFLGTVVLAGGGGGAVVFYLCKVFGERWLNAKFDERLASFKHEQQKEIERLRFRINALMDRTTKLHQSEFDVLPEAWGLLNEAFDKIRGLGFRFDQILDGIPEEQLNDFLSKSPLTNYEQTQVKAASGKTKSYAHFLDQHLLTDALAVYNRYGIYVRTRGIFIERTLLDKFHEIEKLMIDALDECKIKVLEHEPLTWRQEKIAALEQQRKLIEVLEREVHARLWNADSLA